MDIDKRISDIMTKMQGLVAKHPIFTCGKFPPEWGEPLSEEEVRDFEVRNGISLPDDYRRFITTVSKGGTQPFYGLRGIDEISRGGSDEDLIADVKAKFPYTLKKPLNVAELSKEEYDSLFDVVNVDSGFIELCTEGCGLYSILIVNAEDRETYGTVWCYDFSGDAGILPLADPISGKALSFLDWLEYYVERTLELDDDDYFSYAELTVNCIGD